MFFYGWSFQSPSQAGAMKVPLWSTMWRHVIKALWRDYNWWELKHYNHIIVYLDYPYCDTLPDIIHIYTRVNLHLGFHDNINFKPNISYLTTSIILLGIRYTSKMSLYVTQVNEILSIIIQFKVYYIYIVLVVHNNLRVNTQLFYFITFQIQAQFGRVYPHIYLWALAAWEKSSH